jgi:hypothetical protein
VVGWWRRRIKKRGLLCFISIRYYVNGAPHHGSGRKGYVNQGLYKNYPSS